MIYFVFTIKFIIFAKLKYKYYGNNRRCTKNRRSRPTTTYKMKRVLINCIKFYPIVINLYILSIMIAWLIGYKGSFYMIFGQSYMLNFLLLISSLVFKFCNWHRTLIYSMTIILILENIYSIGIRFNNYLYICILLVLFSIILSSILYYKNGCYCEKQLKGEID